jgi:hypothetical protein
MLTERPSGRSIWAETARAAARASAANFKETISEEMKRQWLCAWSVFGDAHCSLTAVLENVRTLRRNFSGGWGRHHFTCKNTTSLILLFMAPRGQTLANWSWTFTLTRWSSGRRP